MSVSPFNVVLNQNVSLSEFNLAMKTIADPHTVCERPGQMYLQCFLQQDPYMRTVLEIDAARVPVLTAPNPWHMPDVIRALEDVLVRFDAYMMLMFTLEPEKTMLNPY